MKLKFPFRIILIAACLVGIHAHAQAQEETYFQKANKLFKQQKWNAGKVFIDQGLAESPLDGDLLMLEGKYYHMKGNNDEARHRLMKALRLDPNNVDAKQILVNVEMQSKHYSAAICYVNELLEVNPYWKGLWRKKIDLYVLQGNEVEAQRLLKRMSQIYPEDAQWQNEYRTRLENDINTLKKSGNVDAALDKANELLKLQGNTESAYTEIIGTFLSSGDKENALRYTNRGLSNFPGNVGFVRKKASILADMGQLNEALLYLKANMRGKPSLTSMYNGLLLENARFQNQSDPYVLYGKIFERNSGNREALTYLLNTSLSRGYYTDAIYYIGRAKDVQGESKEILYKEFMLYKVMGHVSKSDQILVKLYTDYPNDEDIKNLYIDFQYKYAKSLIRDGQSGVALAPLLFILEQPNSDYIEPAMQSLFNAYMNLGRTERALELADSLISMYPDNINNYFKKVSVLLALDEPILAMDLYEVLLDGMDDEERNIHIIGYEEVALEFAKQLIDKGHRIEAFEIIDRILEINPYSELGYNYGLNNSFKTRDLAAFLDYGERAVYAHPSSVHFATKYAEGLFLTGNLKAADSIISPLYRRYPYNDAIAGIKTEIALVECKSLYKQKRGDSLVTLTTYLLGYNPESSELFYYKGLWHEINGDFDSAYYIQSQYIPSPLEEKAFFNHLRWLRNKSYKNQITFSHMRSRFGEHWAISGISYLEYTRFQNSKNTFTARAHYAGREYGAGFLIQGEYFRVLEKGWYFDLKGGYGTRYFPESIAGVNIFKGINKEIEFQLGLGYRNLPNVYSLINAVAGISKQWENIWLNGKLNLYVESQRSFYNVLVDSRFHLFTEGRSYIQAMASVGTIPEIGALNLSLYQTWNATNIMVGFGVRHLFTSRMSGGVMGNWHNIKMNPTHYQNLFNITLQVNYSF